jgi:hypothetical protein
MALAGVLPLTWSRPIPSAEENIEVFAKYAAERTQYVSYQDKIEEALATACGMGPTRPVASRLRRR